MNAPPLGPGAPKSTGGVGRGEGERGFCPRSSRGLRRDRPSRLRPRGGAPTPLTTLPLPPISDCACSHQPAGAGALRNPGVPICALQIPRNVKLVGRGVGEGRQKLGASHPFGKIRSSPVRRGPCWYPEPPSPSPSSFRREISVRVSVHLYLYLCPSRSPAFPWLQKSGVFVEVTPTQSHSPCSSPAVSPSLPRPLVLFCMALQFWRKWKPSSP